MRSRFLPVFTIFAVSCLGHGSSAIGAESGAAVPPAIIPSSSSATSSEASTTESAATAAAQTDQENLAEVAAGPKEKKDSPSAALAPRIQVVTTPANLPFRVLAGAYESANPDVVYTGKTPATVDGLKPGPHRIIFNPEAGAARSMIMQVPDQGMAIFHQEFPYGELAVSSQPAGATVICDGQKVGTTPLKVPLSVGKHQVTAQWKERTARVRSITTADGGNQALSFDFRPAVASKKKAKVEEKPDPLLTRVGRTVGKFFTESAEFVTGKKKP